MSSLRPFAPYAAAAFIAALFAVFQLPEQLGAHPWWALKVIWIGLPIGLVLAFLALRLGLARNLRILLFLLAVCAAAYAATHGKTLFVNSYAEDALAGRFWYFGWIASMAALSGLIASFAQK